MILKDLTLNSPVENILYDEVLLQAAEKGSQGETIRFWESPEVFVVLGRVGKVGEDVDIEKTQKKGVPVLRRSSGGGTVVQGPGCLNFSLILAKERDARLQDIRKSYVFILDKVVMALRQCGINAVLQPLSDLALDENSKKISGNAQHRGRKFILHHGTILYDFDLNLITKYLKMPKKTPDYRQGRGHKDFVTNVPLDPHQLKKILCREFVVDGQDDAVNAHELAMLESSSLGEKIII